MAEHKNRSPKSIITVQLAKLASEFDPFYEKIKGLDRKGKAFRIFKESYLAYRDKMKVSNRLLGIYSKGLIERLQEPPNISRITFMHPFYYLGFVESVGSTMTNMIVMILVSSGIDFHVVEGKWKVKHVTSIKELEKRRNLSLTTKLNFLKENKIKEFASAVDSDLRNKIAHMNFQLEGEEICVRRKPVFSEIGKAWANLSWALIAMVNIIEKLAKDTGLSVSK
jgi:hypothetical protein